MNRLGSVFCKFKKPLMAITFALPVILTLILIFFLDGIIEKSIVVVWLSYMLLSLLFGRVYCGFMCVPGMVQRFFNLIGEVLFKKALQIPPKIDKYLRMFKYLFVTFLIIWSIVKLKILINDHVPFSQYSDLWNNLGFKEGMLDWTFGVFIIVTIIGSIIFKSFYCKYFCLKGSALGLISKISVSRLKLDKNKCIQCGLCTMNCPMNIPVHTLEAVKSMECRHCQQCVAVCPKRALDNTFWGKPITPAVLIPITIIVFILFLLIFSYLF